MEGRSNGNDAHSDIRDRAIELFERINNFIEGDQQILETDTVTVPDTTVTEHNGSETGKCWDSEHVRQHLVSSVVFRSMRHENEDEWELEDFQENMDIGQIDKIGLADNASDLGIYNDQNELKAENKNIILLRVIYDWSHLMEMFH